MIYKTTNQIKLNYSYKHLSEDGLLKKHPLKMGKNYYTDQQNYFNFFYIYRLFEFDLKLSWPHMFKFSHHKNRYFLQFLSIITAA